MSWIDGTRARLNQLIRPSSADSRADEEIRFHIEMETERNVAAGMTPAEARRQAVLAFGSVEGQREQMREGRGLLRLDELWRDLSFAGRTLRKNPGFTFICILTLGVGIGASVAMFSVLDAVLLRDLPVRDEEEVVMLWTAAPSGQGDHLPISQGELGAFRQQTRSLEAVAGVAYQGANAHAVVDGDRTLSVIGSWSTGNFFEVLGVAPVLGRLLEPSDDVPGAAPVMVISHSFWQSHYAGEPGAIGALLEVSGTRYTVVGVVPPGFGLPAGAEFWLPVHARFPEEAIAPTSGYVLWDLVGRLRPGSSVEDAREDFASFLQSPEAEQSAALGGLTPVVRPLAQHLVGDTRSTVWTASAAVALLLLIACVNVASLILIRGSARTGELAIRASLGASRKRLMRQLLTEGALLSFLGGLLGVILAAASIRVFAALTPLDLPRRELIQMDERVLLVALAITAVAALLSGLLPALLIAAGNLANALREGGRSGSASARSRTLRDGLVIVQIALAIPVVIGAGLLIRSLLALQGADVGFEREHLVVVSTSPPDVAERPQQLALLDEMVARVGAIPGVESVTWLPSRPFAGEAGWTAPYTGDGQAAEEQAANPIISLESVGEGYFDTMGLPIQRGRGFGQQDREGAPLVAVVSEVVARQTWPGGDAVGKRIKLGPVEAPAEWYTVVGVVGETRYRVLRDPQPSIYMATRQFGPMPGTIAVRTLGQDPTILSRIRTALREVHPGWTVMDGGTWDELMSVPLRQPRFSALLLTAFALVTLLLAAVGTYGAIAASVRERTREIGIRLALGNTPAGVRRMVMRQGVRLGIIGAVIGLGAAFAGVRALSSMLFEVEPLDWITFAVVAGLVFAGAALASYLPARRASRVSPLTALRS